MYVSQDGTLNGDIRDVPAEPEVEKLIHRTVKKVTDDVEALAFNTAISSMMIFVNEMSKKSVKSKAVMEKFVLILSPMAPHLAEELWQRLGHSQSLAHQPWPEFDPAILQEDSIEIAVMIDGKVRSHLVIATAWSADEVERAVMADQKARAYIAGKTIRQKKYVPKKLFTIALGD
ncbi:MAG: class I tRNA ligase family protein [Candidatus Omnitrophota bacterium]